MRAVPARLRPPIACAPGLLAAPPPAADRVRRFDYIFALDEARVPAVAERLLAEKADPANPAICGW